MSTKQCPKCGNSALGLIRTQNLKFCPDCGHWMSWSLDPGQKPLVGPARAMKEPK